MRDAVPRIAIVGLGPGDPSLRTIGTQRLLDVADQVILRTRIHPGLDDLVADPRVTDCDDLYRSAESFAPLYEAVAERVLEKARGGGLTVFAVPGHPRFGEHAVALIVAKAGLANVPVQVHDAVSFVDAAANAANADPIAHGLQIVDAEHLAAVVDSEPFAAGSLGVDPARPLLVSQIYNAGMAAAVKIALSRVYPDDHAVTVVAAAGVFGNGPTRTIPLHQLDRTAADHLTSLWVTPLAQLDATRAPETLTRVVARLRAPGGCPWDREQTHESLRNAIIAEAYETVDAIDGDDPAGLAEELGDLLLVVSMHAQLAEEEGTFRIEDVYDHVNRKLVRRHPHVFAGVTAETPDAVISTWESVKAAERAGKPRAAATSRYERLPRSMPALRKAIGLLAPRTTLHPPDDASAGSSLLDSVRALIAAGIDPERALEAALQTESAAGNGELVAAVEVAATAKLKGPA